MRYPVHTAVLGAAVLALGGCFDGSSSSSTPGDNDGDGGNGAVMTELFVATASPSQEVGFDPAVEAGMPPACRSVFHYDGVDTLSFDVFCHGIGGATMAHIHKGSARNDGPVSALLYNNEEGEDFHNDRLASGHIQRGDESLEVDFDELLDDLRNDGAYVNVHTMSNPSGEVRGQIVASSLSANALFPSALTGQEVFLVSASPSQQVSFEPSVGRPPPACTSTLVYDGADAIDYRIHCLGIAGVTMAHIHDGSGKEEGGVSAFLFDHESGVDIDDGVLVEGRLVRGGDGLNADFDTILNRLRTDSAYLNVHTDTNPDGEVRGQVVASEPMGAEAEYFVNAASPTQQVGFDPTVDATMPPSCVAQYRYNGFDHIDFDIFCNDISDVSMAHIHRGSAKESGGVDATLFDSDVGMDVQSGRLAQGRLQRAELGDVAFNEMLARMRDDGAYFNAHTGANPDGEVRGQITPIFMPIPELLPAIDDGNMHFLAVATPSQEVDAEPQTATPAPSCLSRMNFDGMDSIEFELYCARIQGVTQAHIHAGSAKENGPVLTFLFESEASVDVDNGLLAAGTLNREDFDNDEAFEGLVEHLRTDSAYVNVHTEANPAGEVRGQIVEMNLDQAITY